MEINTEFIDALNQIGKEKGIDNETIFEAIETSLVTACKKNFGAAQNFRVTIDRKTGKIDVYSKMGRGGGGYGRRDADFD
jgi:N utilization substance protein A